MQMRKLVREVLPWLPPVALMVLIFVLSSMPAGDEDHGPLYVLSRKMAHFGEYFALLVLWWQALATKVPERRALAIALAIAILYAISDELHQTFVSGRAGRPLDVGIDTAGALTAALLISRVRLRRKACA